MSEEENKRTRNYLERLKQSALQQKNYGGEIKKEDASMDARDCPNCGAGRAFRHGLTSCAYCGFVFMEVKLTNGIHIKKENNS
jgi:rubredoxin